MTHDTQHKIRNHVNAIMLHGSNKKKMQNVQLDHENNWL